MPVTLLVSWTEHVYSVQQEVLRAEKSKPTLYFPTGQPMINNAERGFASVSWCGTFYIPPSIRKLVWQACL
jgi:hypothetical protein